MVPAGELEQVAKQTVATIAAQSPLAAQGTKRALVYTRDHPVDESLEWVLLWNQAMLQSEDLLRAVVASSEDKTAEFDDAWDDHITHICWSQLYLAGAQFQFAKVSYHSWNQFFYH